MPASQNQVREALSNPLSWVVGTVGSILAVSASLGVDPITGGIIIGTVIWSNATTIFTATTILGFTIAPEIGFLPEQSFQVAAIVVGFMVVGQVLAKLWDRVKTRVK